MWGMKPAQWMDEHAEGNKVAAQKAGLKKEVEH